VDEENVESPQGAELPVPPDVTPLQRVLALVALLALLASGAITSWWVLTGQVDFGAGRSPDENAVVQETETTRVEIELE
jgi:hypothetical protein